MLWFGFGPDRYILWIVDNSRPVRGKVDNGCGKPRVKSGRAVERRSKANPAMASHATQQLGATW